MTENQPEPAAVNLTAVQAKQKLDDAVKDLEKAAIGTTLGPILPFQLLMMQVDALVQVLADSGVLDRTPFWQEVAQRVEHMATECRKAVLASGRLVDVSKMRGN